jgi:hypothetical protein
MLGDVMFCNQPEENYYSDKRIRQELRARLRFPGIIIAFSLIGAGYFVWQDSGFSTNAVFALLFAAFWCMPFGMILLDLRRVGKHK